MNRAQEIIEVLQGTREGELRHGNGRYTLIQGNNWDIVTPTVKRLLNEGVLVKENGKVCVAGSTQKGK